MVLKMNFFVRSCTFFPHSILIFSFTIFFQFLCQFLFEDLKLQIHLHKALFWDDWFLDSLHKSFLNQTTLDLRKEKWTFLNREFTVLNLVLLDPPTQSFC